MLTLYHYPLHCPRPLASALRLHVLAAAKREK